MVGRSLLHYRIESQLGQGGMGVVYRALDTKLNRPVAIKVLPRDTVADPARKQRFVQEARAASALNHPNIITIHDINTAEDVDFIVMEYVPGKSLDGVIARRGLPVGEALRYAIEIADALAAAHAAGIVHRDLKPGNVMVTDKGHVKVLDFGLAKLVQTAEGDESAATRTAHPQTEVGTIVGTAAYMSPEQAEGRNVDARSDIFSFGAVLYEMLTGRRAFDGTSSISTLAAILHHDPAPIHEFAPGVPRDMVQTVARCLRKDPQRRTQLMADVKLALEDVGSSPETPSAVASDVPRMRSGAVASALAALVVGAGLTFWLLQQSAGSPPVFTPFVTEAGQEGRPAWSPDGKTVAYLGEVKGIRQVLTRSLDTRRPRS